MNRPDLLDGDLPGRIRRGRAVARLVERQLTRDDRDDRRARVQMPATLTA